MYTELLMGALVAIAAPQDPEVRVDTRTVDRRVVEIEIPAIEIPEFDVYIPGFQIAVPSVGWYLEDFEVYWDDVYDWDNDWDDWEDRDYVQDAELDTTFAVDPNAVLGLRNHAGEIIVRTWNRNEVRIQADYSSYDRVKIIQSERSVRSICGASSPTYRWTGPRTAFAWRRWRATSRSPIARETSRSTRSRVT
jgi:hypothetical protein